MLAGTVRLGAVVSLTVTVKLALPVLPAASVAVQFTGVAPMGNLLPEAGVQFELTTPTASLKVADAYVTVAPAALVASATTLAGTVTTGAVPSLTVTVKLALPVLPAASVAVQFTGVAPMANLLPEAGVQLVAREPLTESSAVAVKLTTAPEALVASVVMAAGTVNTGFMVSVTVTVKVAMPMLPAASVAVQVTVVMPSANAEPEAGRQSTVVGETVSTAVGVV
jgi:hypothetical protein